ncbi:hypothetical protein [Hafnia paralvei]|uniref:hypothetical protein n=1 Tax=Hafnia paralvei TaxID=546367 RepID=UPI003D68358F
MNKSMVKISIEDMKELHENLVKSHISKALSGEKMKATDRNADLTWIHGVIVQAAWFVLAHIDASKSSAQAVIPERISPSMAKERALLLGAVIDDDEADAFADGWNTCRTEVLKQHSVNDSGQLLEGWRRVPIEPTEAMLVAGLNEADPLGGLIDWDASRGDCNTRSQIAGIYKAMLVAAAEHEVSSK